MTRNETVDSKTRTQLAGQDRPSLSGRRAAEELLLLCATASISPGRKERISRFLSGTVDWRHLLDLAEFHGLAPLLAHNLATNGLSGQVPPPCLKQLNQSYHNTLYKNVIFSTEMENVLSIFSQHGIAVIALKGTILAEQLYGNPSLRTVVDMDILVRPEELSRSGSLLLETGYQQLDMKRPWEHAFHEVYYKQAQFSLFMELHWNLEDRKLVAVPHEEIWRRAQPLPAAATLVLSPEDNLLFLSNHLTKQDDQLLRSLCDITELIKKYDGVLDWEYIVRAAHSWGIGTGVYYSLKRSKELLGAPVPVSLIRALKPAAWRRHTLELLTGQEAFVSPIKSNKLRSEILAVVHSLMMKSRRQTLLVLSRHRGSWKRAAWLRTATWVMLVFGAALGRHAVRVVSGRKWRDSYSGNNVKS